VNGETLHVPSDPKATHLGGLETRGGSTFEHPEDQSVDLQLVVLMSHCITKSSRSTLPSNVVNV
jgi:hypothetical protein